MRSLKCYPALAMITLFMIIGFSAVAKAETNSSAAMVEQLKNNQNAATKAADTTRDKAAQLASPARTVLQSDEAGKGMFAIEAIAQALALAEQGYRHAAILYGKAAQNIEEDKTDTGSTNALLAESAEDCADLVWQAALEALKLYDETAYQAALEKAQSASQQGNLCKAYAEAGGEEEAGAGPGEQATPIITPPIQSTVDNPLDTRPSGTSSGF